MHKSVKKEKKAVTTEVAHMRMQMQSWSITTMQHVFGNRYKNCHIVSLQQIGLHKFDLIAESDVERWWQHVM